MRLQLSEHIIADSAILAGQPCVAGTSVPASALIARVAAGQSLQEVAAAFQLSLVAVTAALEYGAACASRPPALDDPLLQLAGSLAGRRAVSSAVPAKKAGDPTADAHADR